MFTAPLLSSYILGGIVAALVAINVSGSPLDVRHWEQYSRPHAQPFANAVSTAEQIDRSNKTGQWPTTHVGPMPNTSSTRKDVSKPLLNCEALASPISDPIFVDIYGRCFV